MLSYIPSTLLETRLKECQKELEKRSKHIDELKTEISELKSNGSIDSLKPSKGNAVQRELKELKNQILKQSNLIDKLQLGISKAEAEILKNSEVRNLKKQVLILERSLQLQKNWNDISNNVCDGDLALDVLLSELVQTIDGAASEASPAVRSYFKKMTTSIKKSRDFTSLNLFIIEAIKSFDSKVIIKGQND